MEAYSAFLSELDAEIDAGLSKLRRKKYARDPEREQRIQKKEGVLNENYQRGEETRKAFDLQESRRISLAKVGEVIPFEMYKNNLYLPKIGNEVEINFSFGKNTIVFTEVGVVTRVSETGFQMLDSKNGGLTDVQELIDKKVNGTCTIRKVSHDSSGDCIDRLRRDARMFVEDDFRHFEIISMVENPYAVPGNPVFDVFCQLLDKKYPMMIAYHGTPRANVANILQSRIEPGTTNYYGKGAYFTSNPIKAFVYGSNRFANSRYEQNAEIRDIVACVLSLNPDMYDFSAPRRPVDEIVNSSAQSNLPLFHMRVRLAPNQTDLTELPEGHETFLFDPSDPTTKVLADSSTKKIAALQKAS